MSGASAEVQGHVPPRFASVLAAFEQNFRDGLEVGAATSVVIDGETVVDIWAGHADKHRTQAWRPETIVNVMSVTKGLTATVVQLLGGTRPDRSGCQGCALLA